MFGWVDHAAALDGFLSGMLYVPYALARLSSSVVCRRRPLLLACSAPTVVSSGGWAGVGHARTPWPVLAPPSRYWDERSFVLPLLLSAVGDRQAVGHARTPGPVLASPTRSCGQAFVCFTPAVVCSRGGQAGGHARTPWPVLTSPALSSGQAFVCAAFCGLQEGLGRQSLCTGWTGGQSCAGGSVGAIVETCQPG